MSVSCLRVILHLPEGFAPHEGSTSDERGIVIAVLGSVASTSPTSTSAALVPDDWAVQLHQLSIQRHHSTSGRHSSSKPGFYPVQRSSSKDSADATRPNGVHGPYEERDVRWQQASARSHVPQELVRRERSGARTFRRARVSATSALRAQRKRKTADAIRKHGTYGRHESQDARERHSSRTPTAEHRGDDVRNGSFASPRRMEPHEVARRIDEALDQKPSYTRIAHPDSKDETEEERVLEESQLEATMRIMEESDNMQQPGIPYDASDPRVKIAEDDTNDENEEDNLSLKRTTGTTSSRPHVTTTATEGPVDVEDLGIKVDIPGQSSVKRLGTTPGPQKVTKSPRTASAVNAGIDATEAVTTEGAVTEEAVNGTAVADNMNDFALVLRLVENVNSLLAAEPRGRLPRTGHHAEPRKT